jgi:hypothetical protein
VTADQLCRLGTPQFVGQSTGTGRTPTMKNAADNTHDRANMVLKCPIVRKSEVRGSSMLIGMSDYIVPLISVPPSASNYMCDEKPTAAIFSEQLRTIVASKLILDWSPGQISRMAEESVSPGRKPARVPRNHLPQPIHSSPRSAEKRADSAPAFPAADPPLADITVGKSSMPSPSGKGLRRSRTAPFPGIGRAIC